MDFSEQVDWLLRVIDTMNEYSIELPSLVNLTIQGYDKGSELSLIGFSSVESIICRTSSSVFSFHWNLFFLEGNALLS